MLGAFAPDAEFSGEAAVGLWGCAVDEAIAQLITFVERGLLTQVASSEDYDSTRIRWQQHSLLRAYALALLREQGEEKVQRRVHATIYLALL